MTASEIVSAKSQIEALPYGPSDSKLNTARPWFEISLNDRMVEVIKLFIIWPKERLKKKKQKTDLHNP